MFSPKHVFCRPESAGHIGRAGLGNLGACGMPRAEPVKPVYDAATKRFIFTPVRYAPYWVESSETLGAGSWVQRRLATIHQASQDLTVDFTGEAFPKKEFFRVGTGF